jgi:hypothetical protein
MPLAQLGGSRTSSVAVRFKSRRFLLTVLTDLRTPRETRGFTDVHRAAAAGIEAWTAFALVSGVWLGEKEGGL